MKILFIISLIFAVNSCFGYSNEELTKHGPTPLENYINASQDTYSTLLPFYKQLKAARLSGDKKTELDSYYNIALRAGAFETWSWRFYQYGLKHPETLDPNSKILWQRLATKFKDTTSEPKGASLFTKSPEQIIQGVLAERKFVDHFLSSNHMRNGYKEHHPKEYESSASTTGT